MTPRLRKSAAVIAACHLALASGDESVGRPDLRRSVVAGRDEGKRKVGETSSTATGRATIPAAGGGGGSASGLQLPGCRSLFEWADFIGELDGVVYTGVSQVGLIGSSSTPLFDNPDLKGAPVANLRGSAIVDQRDLFATGTPTFHFLNDSNSLLTFLLGFSVAENANGPEGNYGIPLGGTGEWSGFQGFIYNSRLTSRYESPYIVNYTICSSQ